MFPLIRDGDYVLLWAIAKPEKLDCGDVIQVRHKDFGVIIKVVSLIKGNTVRVKGLSKLSTESQILGDFNKSDIEYRAIVVFSNFQKPLFGIGSFRVLTRRIVQNY